ncbi:AP-3 complex subunit delta-1-like [Oscarella lobularis]|uniref:AP-3 complex subunit delta-1-like n=1 Tax=Oscarella lobularis TaxID=121494 RepID=UPI0033140209
MFEKSLHDLVRGIRNNKQNEARYIAGCIDEIKSELRQESKGVKATAVAKLIYLQMIGYDISWAAFNIVEVMSSQKFTHKRIGYLAATQCFHDETDVLMLTTNMIKKDMSSHNLYDAGTALTGLSCFVSNDLARDLANDLMALLASIRPYVKKKAILVMYKVFLKFPDSLRPAFPRLKERLEDADPGVQSAAVNVICELARKNPKNYLALAPIFFKLMTASTNNWMLIKIIKLFAALAPLEPRLGKKLIEPLTNLIHSTSAMSLLYECVNTMISAVPTHVPSMQLCVTKLRVMIEDPDQNLKYLGLLALGKILKHHPKAVQAHKELVMGCLEDRDESIRLRSLDLIYGMVNRKNLVEIIKKLMLHVDSAEGSAYRDELVSKIMEICAQSNYQNVVNFEWYISILVDLTHVEGTNHGKMIADQLLDVAIRVRAVRSFAVKQMARVLENMHVLAQKTQQNGVCEVLYAAAWISGEFPSLLDDVETTLEALLVPRALALPGHIQSIFVQNIIKLYAYLFKTKEEEEDDDEDEEREDDDRILKLLLEKLPLFLNSPDLEVQERASCVLQILKYMPKMKEKGAEVAEELAELFEGELNPVAPKAQKKVPLPEGLDLDKWINDQPSESSDEEDFSMETAFISQEKKKPKTREEIEEQEEEYEKKREARRQSQLNNPHYLQASSKQVKSDGVDRIPVASLKLDVPLKIETDFKIEKKSKKKKRRKGGRRKNEESSDDDIPRRSQRVDITTEEMPEGAVASDGERGGRDDDDDTADPHRALDIDLEKPLEADEVLPVRKHRVVTSKTLEEVEEEQRKAKKERRKTKEKEKEKKRKHKKHRKHKEKEEEKEEEEEEVEVAEVAVEPVKEEEDAREKSESKKKRKGKQKVEEKVVEVKPVATKPEQHALDDYEFWLSKPNEAETEKAEVEKVVVAEKEEKPKKQKTPKKVKGEKKKKKKEKEEEQPPPAISDEQKIEEPEEVEIIPTYLPLASDENVDLTYELRVNPSINNQVVASVIFKNLSGENQLINMEFNVLDSLNTKMIRPIGSPSHDGIQVPFQLPPGIANEAQFAFMVDGIQMPQKLRGTLTYMIKRSDGATSEKLDFKLSFPCSGFIYSATCDGKEFSELLSGGKLCEAQTLKIKLTKSSSFAHALRRACTLFKLSVIERVEGSASLYGRTIQKHHVCVLVKMVDDSEVSVSGKCSDSMLISQLLNEFKTEL